MKYVIGILIGIALNLQIALVSIYLSVDGHLDCFHHLVIVNNAAMTSKRSEPCFQFF